MTSSDTITQIYMPPREAIRHLVTEGVVRGLDEKSLDELREECWDGSEEQLEEAGLLSILTFYYQTVERGAEDGFVWHAEEFWNDTDDVVREVALTLRTERPLFRQVSAAPRMSTADGERDAVLVLELERDDGARQEIEARSLGDVVAVFNDELKARGATKRLLPLDTGGDWEMFVALELKLARRLTAEGALPVADVDMLAP